MRIIYPVLFLSLVFFFNAYTIKAQYLCEKFSPLSFFVGSDPIVLSSEKKVSKIQGVVLDLFEKPPLKAYIYLFSKPDNVTDEDYNPFNLKVEEILSACETGKNGEFHFENFPRGKYIVCANTPNDSNFVSKTTCVFTKLEPENKNLKRKLKLPLEVQDL